MTREEAIAKYSDVKCFFFSYYKHRFTFRGIADDGRVVFLRIGGYGGDDIYRFSCEVENPETIRMNNCGVNDPAIFSVEEANGEVVYES